MPYCSTSFRFSWASPVETTTGTGRSPPPSGSAARSGAILVQYPHCGLKKMSSTFLSRNSESLWRTPVRSGSSKSGASHADRQAAGLPSLLPGCEARVVSRLPPAATRGGHSGGRAETRARFPRRSAARAKPFRTRWQSSKISHAGLRNSSGHRDRRADRAPRRCWAGETLAWR